MKVVYVAGPYRADCPWHIEQNVRKAEEVALEVWQAGFVAVCPHAMNRFYQHSPDTTEEMWAEGLLELMYRCDYILLVEGWRESAGTIAEVGAARARNIPYFESLEELITHHVNSETQTHPNPNGSDDSPDSRVTLLFSLPKQDNDGVPREEL